MVRAGGTNDVYAHDFDDDDYSSADEQYYVDGDPSSARSNTRAQSAPNDRNMDREVSISHHVASPL